MQVIDLTAMPVGPTEFGQWAALNGPLGLGGLRRQRGRGRSRRALDSVHDEVESAQEELFVVVSGRARFVVGDETLRRRPGHRPSASANPAAQARLRGRSTRARACSASARRRRARPRAGATGSAAASREVTTSSRAQRLITRAPSRPADEARARRDEALAAPAGGHHRDARPGALQDERERAAVRRVDRVVEERGVAGTTRRARAPRPSAPTVQMPMRPLASKPMNATRRPSGRTTAASRTTSHERAHAGAVDADRPERRAALRLARVDERAAVRRPGRRARAQLRRGAGRSRAGPCRRDARGRSPSPPSGPRGRRSSGRRATRPARGRGRARGACPRSGSGRAARRASGS